MTGTNLASIVINNYNYAPFLRQAIDSALNQTWPDVEVIVVDDGSADQSRDIIAGYGRRISAILQANGGQNSALNAGFAASRGKTILFVDSDDALLPTAAEAAMRALSDPSVVKAHWPWLEWDESSRATGRVWGRPLPECDLRGMVLREGPDCLAPYLPSGNAYPRSFLDQVFPLPDARRGGAASANGGAGWEARPGPDLYLATLAALYGPFQEVAEPQACYRMHGRNGYQSLRFEERLCFDLALFDYVSGAAAGHCAKLGLTADRERWKASSWAHRLRQSTLEIEALVPDGESFILVDEDRWKTDPVLAGRVRIPFLERDGSYWGNPSNDTTAIEELERLRRAGARFIVFPWSAFWWFDHYTGLREYLRARYARGLENDRLVAYDLRKEAAAA